MHLFQTDIEGQLPTPRETERSGGGKGKKSEMVAGPAEAVQRRAVQRSPNTQTPTLAEMGGGSQNECARRVGEGEGAPKGGAPSPCLRVKV